MDLNLCELLFLVLLIIPSAVTQCSFPTTMVSTGNWLTSTRGTWTVESTVIHNFTVNTKTNGVTDTYSFDCYNKTTEGYYIIKSTTTFQPFAGDWNIYVCLNFDVTSTTNLKYYLLTTEFTVTSSPSTINERLRYIEALKSPTSNADVCTDSTTFSNQERLHVAIASNNITGAKLSFPCDFQAEYSYHASVAACTTSNADICESSIVFNYTLCTEPQIFSLNGTLSNIYYGSSTSGSTTTYTMYLYNDDPITPDETTYYTFSCMIFAITTNTAGSQISASVHPKVCLDSASQTSSFITGSTGSNLTFTNLGTSTCADPVCATTTTSTTTPSTTSSTTTNTTTTAAVASAGFELWYIIIIIIIILIIIAILIIIFCCIRKRRRSKIDDEEAPITKEDDEDKSDKENDKEEDVEEEDKKMMPTTSKKDDEEEDQRSVDSGYRGDKEDVSPLPAVGEEKGAKEEEKVDDEEKDEEDENETTKFVAEEPERENENLNKEEEQKVDRDDEVKDEQRKEEKEQTEEVLPINDDTDSIKQEVEKSVTEDNKNEDDVKSETKSIVENQDMEEEQPARTEEKEEKEDQADEVDEKLEEKKEQADEEKLEKDEQKTEDEEQLDEKVEQVNKDEEQLEEKVEQADEEKSDDGGEQEEAKQIEEKEEVDADDEHSNNDEQEREDEKADTVSQESHTDKAEVEQGNESETEVSEKDNKAVIIPKEALEKIDNTEEKEHSPEPSIHIDPEETREKESMKNEQANKSPVPSVKEKESRKEDNEEVQNVEDSSRENSEDDEFYEGGVDDNGNPVRIGLKKRRGKYMPTGTLTNVLVTRDMEEKKRNKARSKKRGKIMTFFAKGKSKKTGEKQDRDSSPDSQAENTRKHEGGIRAEFMAQYEHKKHIEKELDEQHYWSDEKEEFNYEGEFEFDVFPPDTKETIGEKADDKIDEKENDGKSRTHDKNDTGNQNDTSSKAVITKRSGTSELTETKEGVSDDEQKLENGKDSGMETGGESPDPKLKIGKDTKGITDDEVSDDDIQDIYSDSDEDMFELPQGLIRDTEGRIIRVSDGRVVSDDVTERAYKKARLGRLFNIPRLKRSKQGRPTGGFIEDTYGPKPDDKYSNGENEDGPIIKYPRQSNGLPVVSDIVVGNNGNKTGGKNVMFDIQNNELDLPGLYPPGDVEPKDRRNVNSAVRRLLKKRLFKQKRKQDKQDSQIIMVGGAKENPRELNSLLKVYGRPNATVEKPVQGMPPSKYQRQGKGVDQEQMLRNREGLARDRDILNRLGGSPDQRNRPFPPKEAFIGQSDNMIEEISLEDGLNETWADKRNTIDIGNEDEFVLVGKGGQQEQPSRLFTMVKHPSQGDGTLTQKSFDTSFLRHQHEKRHAIPWSLLQYGPSRELTKTDLSSSETYGVSKSAGTSREKIDDRRLKELLEELYRDKKYFDHVVETTDTDNKSEIDERDLAEHGRDYLLDRAEFWEDRGPLPPRPPTTALGMRISRLQQHAESGRISTTSTTSSQIPNMGNQTIPGQIDNENQKTENENSVT